MMAAFVSSVKLSCKDSPKRWEGLKLGLELALEFPLEELKV